MRWLLLSFSQKTSLLSVSQDTDAVLCEFNYASEKSKHYLE